MGSPLQHIFRSKLPDIHIPDHLSLTQYCFEHIAQFAHNPCLIQSNGKHYTYSEVELYTRRIAAGFSNLGIEKGDVVMLLLPNCVEFVLLFLGLAARGAIATTCNPFSTAREVAKQVNASGAKLIITQAAFIENLAKVATATTHSFKVMTTDDAPVDMSQFHISMLTEADEKQCPHVDIHPDDVVGLLYSSGTTGLPKGVMLTHKSLITNIAQQVDGENPNSYMTSDDVLLCVLPLFHVYALGALLLCGLRVGASIAVMGKFELVGMLDVIEKLKVTMAFLVPPIVLALAKNQVVGKYNLSSLRVVMSGASPIGKELEASLQERLPQAIIGQGYGLTEAGPVVAMSLSFAKYPFPGKVGSCGTVVRNAEMKIVDLKTGDSLPCNKQGEICIRGKQVMKGYLGDLEATKNAIDKDGFFHTGDIGLVDDDGEVFILDRVKEIMKVKGFQVSPAELEAILLSHPAIIDAACVPRKHELQGEVPIAFIVRAPNSDITEISIKEFVAKQVIFYKKLHEVHFVEAIPKTPSGKILRKELSKAN